MTKLQFYDVIKPNQIEVDEIFISIKNLENRLYYEAKQEYFKKILSKCESIYNSYQFFPTFQNSFLHKAFDPLYYCQIDNELESVNYCRIIDDPSLTVSYFHEGYPYIYGLSPKEKILIELIQLAEKLKTYHFDQDLRDRFNSLEFELSIYLDGFDRILLHPEIYGNFLVIQKTNEDLKLLRKRLRSTLKRKVGIFLRDIRQFFRNIIKFLFKNMDDESDRSNALEFVFHKALSDFKNIHHYAKEGNYRTFNYCT